MASQRLDHLASETRQRGYSWRADDVLQRLLEWTPLHSGAEAELQSWLQSESCDAEFQDDYPEWSRWRER
jgi:hypothetical protein